jgi:hypothetical protein
MSSIDTTQQNNPDDRLPWHGLSTQQLREAGLNISDIEQRKINKSLTRLSVALKSAGLNWAEDLDLTCDAITTDHDKESFETFLATYR